MTPKKCAIFCAIFLKCDTNFWHIFTFGGGKVCKSCYFAKKNGTKRKNGTEVSQLEPLIYKGLRVFVPFFHFFCLLSCKSVKK